MSRNILKSLRNIFNYQRNIFLAFEGNGIRCFATTNITFANYGKTCTVPLPEKQQTISDHTKREVNHHSNLASTWWDINGPLAPLHHMNAIRVPFIRDGLVTRGFVDPKLVNTIDVLKNQQILEVGCGGGILTEELARLGAKMTAIDLSNELINVARERLKQDARLLENITYKIEPIEVHMKDKSNFYDAVVISEVLEHIDDKVPFLNACVQCAKPGGSVFISTLNKTIRMWVAGVLIGEYILKVIPRGTHHWKYMISPENVQKMLDTMGCQTVLVNGSIYEFWRKTWRKINSTSTCYALHAIKTKSN